MEASGQKTLIEGFLAIIEIFPDDSVKTSAIIDVSPKDLACKRKQGSQL